MNQLDKNKIFLFCTSAGNGDLYLTLGLTFWHSVQGCNKPFIYNYTTGDFIFCKENESHFSSQGYYTAARSARICDSKSRVSTIKNVIRKSLGSKKDNSHVFVAIHIIYSDEANFFCSDLFSEDYLSLFKVDQDFELKFIEGEKNILDIIPVLEHCIPYSNLIDEKIYEFGDDSVWCDKNCSCGFLQKSSVNEDTEEDTVWCDKNCSCGFLQKWCDNNAASSVNENTEKDADCCSDCSDCNDCNDCNDCHSDYTPNL